MIDKLACLLRGLDSKIKAAADSPIMPDASQALPAIWEPRINGALYRITLERLSPRQSWRNRKAGQS